MQQIAELALRCLVAAAASGVVNVLAVQIGAGGSRAKRIAAGIVAAATLAIPFFIDGPPLFILLTAHVVALNALRALEGLARPAAFGSRERLVRVLLPFETTLMKRVPRSFATFAVLTSALRLAAGVTMLFVAAHVAGPTTPYHLAGWPRWSAAAIGTYLVFDGGADQIKVMLAAFGWEHPPLHRSPIRARSLAEFWGARWNFIVSHGLRMNVFSPLARRRAARLGLFASFITSGAMHMYLFVPAVGLTTSLWLGAFFLVHGVLVLVEARLGVRRLRPAVGHAFVVASFGVTLPLFTEPALRGIGL